MDQTYITPDNKEEINVVVGEKLIFWDYTASHSHIRILVSPKNTNEFIFIHFYDCAEMNIIPSWTLYEFDLLTLDSEWLNFLDSKNNISIRCRSIAIEKNANKIKHSAVGWVEARHDA